MLVDEFLELRLLYSPQYTAASRQITGGQPYTNTNDTQLSSKLCAQPVTPRIPYRNGWQIKCSAMATSGITKQNVTSSACLRRRSALVGTNVARSVFITSARV